MRVLRALLLLLSPFGLGASASAAPPASSTPPPLTEEAVVRLFLDGTPAGELIRRIRQDHVRFSLDDDMARELREAGLPDSVIRAMQQRQRDLDRRERRRLQDAPAEPIPGPTWVLTARVNPEQKRAKKRRLLIYDQADPSEDRAWGVETRYLDLALFLVCTTPDHVPDHWRQRSPVGRSRTPVPRHRLLALHAGAGWRKSTVLDRVGLKGSATPPPDPAQLDPAALIESRDSLGLLELPLPPELAAELTAEVTHDLAFGVAARVADRFDVLAVAALDNGISLVEDRAIVATVEARNRVAEGLEVRLAISE